MIPSSGHAPDIAALIQKYGSIGAAERAAGLYAGLFSKIATGRVSVDAYQERITQALKEEAPPMSASNVQNLPKTCPPLLAELIQKFGGITQAAKAIESSSGTFGPIVKGERDISPELEIRIKAALGHSVLGITRDEPPLEPSQKPIPAMKPWDGKLVTVKTISKVNGKTTAVKVPGPVAALLAMFDNSRTDAAAALGRTAGWLHPIIQDPKKFTVRAQEMVHAALHGVVPQDKHSMGEEYDKYTLGIAIVMMAAPAFDRVQDIADILNGRLVFRKNTKGGWLVIYRMTKEDLPKFKRLALRDANEIVCP